MISVVTPIYNERENLNELHRQLAEVLQATKEEWELILVDDGSRDDSFDVIKELVTRDAHVRGLRFSRNFGQYAAVTAGIELARGDAVIIMDADLQEPPSLIPQLIKEWRSGHKAVYTTAVKRQDSAARRLLGAGFYRIFGNASFLGNVQNISEMRLIDREMVDAFKLLHEKPRFIKGLFFWLGYKHTFVMYEKQKRAAGESKYSYGRLAKLALDGIFSFSFFPIQIITSGGIILFAASILFAIVALATHGFGAALSLIVILVIFTALFFAGLQLIALGILGEYVGRIYDEVRGRPTYIIEERIGTHE